MFVYWRGPVLCYPPLVGEVVVPHGGGLDVVSSNDAPNVSGRNGDDAALVENRLGRVRVVSQSPPVGLFTHRRTHQHGGDARSAEPT